MKIDVLGCRGSTPIEGESFDRYGGATSCLAISSDDDAPSLLLDAGTGLRHLGRLTEAPFRGSVLLSHLHWDHVQGLPFAALLDHPDSRVEVVVPWNGTPAKEIMTRFMSPPLFPIGPERLKGEWTFSDVKPGRLILGPFEVEAFEVPHKGGRTFGYRVANGRRSLAYVPDHATRPGRLDPGLVESMMGVNVLIHDGQHLDGEAEARSYLGHSTVGYALDLAREAGAEDLVLFHHDPGRTDDQLDSLAGGLPTWASLARQGATL